MCTGLVDKQQEGGMLVFRSVEHFYIGIPLCNPFSLR